MANALSTKQIAAMDTIATHTNEVGKEITLNMHSLMGSIEATNIVSTRAVIATLESRGFLKINGDLKDESIKIKLTIEGLNFITSKKDFSASSANIEKIITGEVIEEIVVSEPVVELIIEPIVVLQTIKEVKLVDIPTEKVKKEKLIKPIKEKIESKDEDGNFCPKKGDERGSKSWNIYQFLRQPHDNAAPGNKIIKERMSELGGFHTVYYSEIERVRQNYTIVLKR